jgi:nucleotide-binding universal stress UspA family protein
MAPCMSTSNAYRSNIILAAVDFSDSSTAVVEQALGVAQRRRPVELHFLHVNQSAKDDDEGREGRRFEQLEWLGARLPQEEGALDGIVVNAHEANGDPWRTIVQMASDLVADLVVVGTHNRKGLERLMMGSVAEAVSRHCGCSVLVVRRKSHDIPVLELEPPCGVCAEARVESQGGQLWCHDHVERHDRRSAFYDRGFARWVRQSLVP